MHPNSHPRRAVPQAPRQTKLSTPRQPRTPHTPFPGFIDPCLATLLPKPPETRDFLHEIKYDGYRTQAHLRNGRCTLYTRRGYNWTQRFASVAKALASLNAAAAILDGEVVVPDSRGLSDFHELQNDLAQGRTDRLVYFVFDLLYLNGQDLRPLPLEHRKRLLTQLLDQLPEGRVRLSQHIDAEGAQVFERACDMHLEGIISKQRDSPYRSGRQPTWIKSKCTRSDTFPIVAFVEKLGARPRRIASLYVGRREGNRLLYAGKVNTGYTELIQRDLRERLDRYIRRTTPLSVPVKKPKATWVEPKLQAEVQYGSLTSAHLLRQAVYKGLRDDLTDEPPVPTASIKGATPRSPRPIRVPKENILQLLPDAVSPSREELATYWKKVAKRALPFLGNRPLKLVRTVHGTTFYHRGPLPPIPPSVHELKIRKREGGEGTRLWIDDLAGFLGLIEIGAVELHPWNATVDDIEHVDQIVFDLDPGEGIDWPFVKETALTLREQLQTEGVSSWPKLTGGKGLHIMVPVVAHSMTHDEAHNYSKHIAQALARTNPTRYTTIANFAARRGRLFIDYLRNGRGTTAVGTYSPRARPGFPIAAPVTWKSIESTQTLRPDTFSMGHLPPAPAKPHKPTA